MYRDYREHLHIVKSTTKEEDDAEDILEEILQREPVSLDLDLDEGEAMNKTEIEIGTKEEKSVQELLGFLDTTHSTQETTTSLRSLKTVQLDTDGNTSDEISPKQFNEHFIVESPKRANTGPKSPRRQRYRTVETNISSIEDKPMFDVQEYVSNLTQRKETLQDTEILQKQSTNMTPKTLILQPQRKLSWGKSHALARRVNKKTSECVSWHAKNMKAYRTGIGIDTALPPAPEYKAKPIKPKEVQVAQVQTSNDQAVECRLPSRHHFATQTTTVDPPCVIKVPPKSPPPEMTVATSQTNDDPFSIGSLIYYLQNLEHDARLFSLKLYCNFEKIKSELEYCRSIVLKPCNTFHGKTKKKKEPLNHPPFMGGSTSVSWNRKTATSKPKKSNFNAKPNHDPWDGSQFKIKLLESLLKKLLLQIAFHGLRSHRNLCVIRRKLCTQRLLAINRDTIENSLQAWIKFYKDRQWLRDRSQNVVQTRKVALQRCVLVSWHEHTVSKLTKRGKIYASQWFERLKRLIRAWNAWRATCCIQEYHELCSQTASAYARRKSMIPCLHAWRIYTCKETTLRLRLELASLGDTHVFRSVRKPPLENYCVQLERYRYVERIKILSMQLTTKCKSIAKNLNWGLSRLQYSWVQLARYARAPTLLMRCSSVQHDRSLRTYLWMLKAYCNGKTAVLNNTDRVCSPKIRFAEMAQQPPVFCDKAWRSKTQPMEWHQGWRTLLSNDVYCHKLLMFGFSAWKDYYRSILQGYQALDHRHAVLYRLYFRRWHTGVSQAYGKQEWADLKYRTKILKWRLQQWRENVFEWSIVGLRGRFSAWGRWKHFSKKQKKTREGIQKLILLRQFRQWSCKARRRALLTRVFELLEDNAEDEMPALDSGFEVAAQIMKAWKQYTLQRREKRTFHEKEIMADLFYNGSLLLGYFVRWHKSVLDQHIEILLRNMNEEVESPVWAHLSRDDSSKAGANSSIDGSLETDSVLNSSDTSSSKTSVSSCSIIASRTRCPYDEPERPTRMPSSASSASSSSSISGLHGGFVSSLRENDDKGGDDDEAFDAWFLAWTENRHMMDEQDAISEIFSESTKDEGNSRVYKEVYHREQMKRFQEIGTQVSKDTSMEDTSTQVFLSGRDMGTQVSQEDKKEQSIQVSLKGYSIKTQTSDEVLYGRGYTTTKRQKQNDEQQTAFVETKEECKRHEQKENSTTQEVSMEDLAEESKRYEDLSSIEPIDEAKDDESKFAFDDPSAEGVSMVDGQLTPSVQSTKSSNRSSSSAESCCWSPRFHVIPVWKDPPQHERTYYMRASSIEAFASEPLTTKRK